LALSWLKLPCVLKAAIGIGKQTLAHPASLSRHRARSKAYCGSGRAGLCRGPGAPGKTSPLKQIQDLAPIESPLTVQSPRDQADCGPIALDKLLRVHPKGSPLVFVEIGIFAAKAVIASAAIAADSPKPARASDLPGDRNAVESLGPCPISKTDTRLLATETTAGVIDPDFSNLAAQHRRHETMTSFVVCGQPSRLGFADQTNPFKKPSCLHRSPSSMGRARFGW
jgi:hypothetical protein